MVYVLESENLHTDVREGRLVNSSSDDKKFGSEGEERNPPSNGQLYTHILVYST